MGLIISLIIGAIAGWLAGEIVEGDGFGLIGNIVIGIIGAMVGSFLLRSMGKKDTPDSFIGEIITATLGAVVLLFVLNVIGLA